MRTTVIIDDTLLQELMQDSEFKSRSEGIREAIAFYLARKRVQRFKSLAGSRLVDLDWRELEERELDEFKADEERTS